VTILGTLFLHGFIIGFALAMVIGPIGIWCIQQTLSRGFWAGLAVGLGAATADGIYGALAGLGMTYIVDVLLQAQRILQTAGGIFLCYLGIKTLLARPVTEPEQTQATTVSWWRLYSATLLLTLANPITIVTFTALFAALGVTTTNAGGSSVIILFTSIYLGSTLWWILLSGGLTLVRKRISLSILNTINTISGCIMTGFGVIALLSVLV
jgi:threonine/homoserine/homoserine lactone efflux protein